MTRSKQFDLKNDKFFVNNIQFLEINKSYLIFPFNVHFTIS